MNASIERNPAEKKDTATPANEPNKIMFLRLLTGSGIESDLRVSDAFFSWIIFSILTAISYSK